MTFVRKCSCSRKLLISLALCVAALLLLGLAMGIVATVCRPIRYTKGLGTRAIRRDGVLFVFEGMHSISFVSCLEVAQF